MTTDLDTLLTAPYVKIDDWSGESTRTGRPPPPTDAELLAQAGLPLGDHCRLALAARPDRATLTADGAWTRVGAVAAIGVSIPRIR